MKLVTSIATLVILAHATVVACTCGARAPIREAFAEADAVFEGRCIAGKVVAGDFGGRTIDECEFTFEITRTWKGGKDRKRVVVTTGVGGSGDCGFGFEIGSSYVVYARGTDRGLYTTICDRTYQVASLPRSDNEMKELDAIVAEPRK